MKIKLQSDLTHRKNSRVQFPYCGLTEFDSDGIALVEISDEKDLPRLLEAIGDLKVFVPKDVENEIPPQIKLDEIGLPLTEESKIGEADDSVPLTDLAKQLSAMKLPDLKQLAGDSGFPLEKWGNLTKQPLIAYLKAKLEATDAAN